MKDLLHLFFPHYCAGCGTAVLEHNAFLCARCIHHLPVTHFFNSPNNPVERSLYGRLNIQQAGATFYFTKDSLVQELMVQLKYRGHAQAGLFLGRMTGRALAKSARFEEADVLIPLPLNPKKEYQRGYNQATLICEGIREVWKKPILTHVITRNRFTHTQTHQNRLHRWENMQGVFSVTQPSLLKHKHLLLVDDVVTTGATLEACGTVLLAIPGVRLSLAAAAYTV